MAAGLEGAILARNVLAESQRLQLCSEWGIFSVAQSGDSVVRVDWEIEVSVEAENDMRLETYVR